MNINLPNPNKQIWRNAIFSFLAVLSCILFIFWNTFYGMVSIWARSETFTHGFLVLPIVIWLIWRKRYFVFARIPKPNYFILFFIIVISIVWLLGDLVAINSVTQLASTALVVLSVFAIFGWSVTSVIVFPLFFLFFSVPLGEFLLPLLMEWTAKFTVIAIRLSGVPVYQEGLQFVISSGNWSVVEACSGVRYLISSVMIGTLYAYLNYQSLDRRLIFIGVSIVIPVLANWIRAYFIVMLGHFSENKLAVGFDHLIYGWVFFGVVILLMFLIGGRWAENEISVGNYAVHAVVDKGARSSYFWINALLIAIAMAVPIGWGEFIKINNRLSSPIISAPNSFSSTWSQVDEKLQFLKPNFQGSIINIDGVYKKDLLLVGFYVAYYRNQNYDNKLVSSENSIVSTKSKEWLQTGGENYVLQGTLNPLSVRVTNLRGLGGRDQIGNSRLQAWQFYWVNGVFTDNDYKAKVHGAMQRLFGRGDDSAIILLYAQDDGEGLAKKSMEKFLQDNYAEIKLMLEAARSE
nr:exosortase A [uncultured Albidiferax sp.]